MRKIGVLTADKMGGLSQSFCLQRMREARLDSTIVMSRYFSNSARSDFKVSGADSLLRILDRFRDDDVLLFSRLSKAYLPMARDAEVRHLDDGEARRFGLHLNPVSEPMTRKAAQAALDGASMSFTVGGFKAAMGAGEPEEAPETEDDFEDVAPPRPSIGILLSGRLSAQTVGRCVDEFRQSGIDDVIVFDPNGRTPGCARTMQELAAKITAGRSPEDSNDEAPKGFDDRMVLCVTEAERVSDTCTSIAVRKGRFQLFCRDGESKTVPAFRFNPSEIQAYGSFAAYAGDLFKAIELRVAIESRFSRESETVQGEEHPGWLGPEERRECENGRQVLTLAFMTHNRTAVACHCLDAYCRRLKYAGKIRYCICDDRSDRGHVEALEKVLVENGVEDYEIVKTSPARYGLGASMNNGLDSAFSKSDIVLTTEDDFLLLKDFDITSFVDLIVGNGIAGIRLATLWTGRNRQGSTYTGAKESEYPGMWKVVCGTVRNPREQYVFNNQVMLRHRRVYDAIGTYAENARMEEVECGMCARYVAKASAVPGLDVLYPKSLLLNTLSNGLFEHIGVSTAGHARSVNTAYRVLNSREADSAARASAISEPAAPLAAHAGGDPVALHIVTPFYNCAGKLARCLKSVSSQNYPLDSVVMTVVDDASDSGESAMARSECSKYPFARFIRNDVRTMAGGARNTALRCGNGLKSEYTVFLDADDVLLDSTSLTRLETTILAAGRPDVVMCGFVFNGSGKRRMFTAANPEQMAAENAIAPWTRVVRTEKVKEFVENRRVANDVVQFLRQMDSVDTVASMGSPFIRYMDDNGLSGRNGSVKRTRDAVYAMCMVAPDIMSEKFLKPYTARRAAELIRQHVKLASDMVAHADGLVQI